MAKHKKRVSLSGEIIEYLLRKTDMTLQDLAARLNMSKSFLSRVKNGERNLTIPHLEQIEKVAKEALPIILVRARSRTSVPRQLHGQYSALKKVSSSDTLELLGRLGVDGLLKGTDRLDLWETLSQEIADEIEDDEDTGVPPIPGL